MERFLAPTRIIDWQTPAVRQLAAELATGLGDDVAVARACFEWVRDEVRHSWDYRQNPVTCKASDVLKHRTGYCYAKSHLLAALLRANGIPAGLCYQRLSIGDDGAPYCLHGLNAVYLQRHGWYRCDARGNKPGIDAQFSPPQERLAFTVGAGGADEADLVEIWTEPSLSVVSVLENSRSVEEAAENLPDVALLSSVKR
ncbi:MAG TPA: transglutaminase family protein [Gammaproteobacteria bacterium]|nr:transglutaminase family protein [Gammaproteobacteria bacterium]